MQRILAILAAVLGVTVVFLLWRGEPRLTTTADPPALLREIQRLDELVAVKYSLQKVVGLREEKVPVGEESLLLIVQARVLGGIELSKMSVDNVRLNATDRAVLRLPAPRILHVYLDEKETQVWDRKITWWTPWVPYNKDLERQARLKALEEVKKTALDMGILDEAQRNAELAIRALLTGLGIREVQFAPAS